MKLMLEESHNSMPPENNEWLNNMKSSYLLFVSKYLFLF